MQERYTATARALHWLTALMVLALVGFGIWITAFAPKDEAFKYKLYNIHESLGFTLLLVTMLRMAWRVTHPPPPLAADLPARLRTAAQTTHGALYVLLLVQPVVGVLATNAWGFPFVWWRVVAIPSPVGENSALAPIFSGIHYWCALLMVTLVCLHSGAALWHQFIRRDGTLEKML